MWIRTFPMGGHNFTNQLVESFKLGYPKAEKLKREADQSQHARHILQAMRPVFTDLAQDVQRSIGYYQSLHKDANLTRLIGLGATFHLPGLPQYLKQQLGMEVYRLEEWKRPVLTDLGEERTKVYQDSSLEMATAMRPGPPGRWAAVDRRQPHPGDRRAPRVSGARRSSGSAWRRASASWPPGPCSFVRSWTSRRSRPPRATRRHRGAIRQAINTSQRLKSEAEQAGVTGRAPGRPACLARGVAADPDARCTRTCWPT